MIVPDGDRQPIPKKIFALGGADGGEEDTISVLYGLCVATSLTSYNAERLPFLTLNSLSLFVKYINIVNIYRCLYLYFDLQS